jgi:general secretion pathway protein E/type IV pilus assembly protein PilB
MKIVPTEKITIATELIQCITPEQAWHYSIIPVERNGSFFILYIDKNNNSEVIKEELELVLNCGISLISLSGEEISFYLNRYYRRIEKKSDKSLPLLKGKSEDFLRRIITEAGEIGCSDIHFESFEEKCRIRFRIDGKLKEKFIIDKNEYPAIINKIKIKANLDIAEKRLPQDGRIYFKEGNESVDIRVSIISTLFGEKVVLRLLSRNSIDNLSI